MSALFVRPLNFAAVAGTTTPTTGAVISLNDDTAMAVSLPTTSYIIIDLGASVVAYDTIALVATNLRATDTVQVQTGTSPTGTGGYSGTATAAWSGTKPDTATAKAIVKLPSTRTERYVRIDFSAPSHPDTYVRVVRLVIGAAIVTQGVAFDAEMSVIDRGIVTSGPGFATVDIYDMVIAWKISCGWIPDAIFRQNFAPMFLWGGISRAILFVVDDTQPANWQTDATFGRWNSNPVMKLEAANLNRVEGTLTSIYQ